MSELLGQLVAGRSLSRRQAEELFAAVVQGGVEPELLGAILTALAMKGETADELAGAASAMRRSAVPVRSPAGAIDTCSTGGDGISTFNVSTCAAIIAGAAGAVVAKHGNHTSTRASGSADVLAVLGVNIEAPLSVVQRCLNEIGLAFLHARKLHPAMGHAAGARKALGIRTIFNYLGPLTNPAGVRRQVVGVSRPDLVRTYAQVLLELGAEHAWVTHGSDGLCDLTISGPSSVAEVRDGRVLMRQVHPSEVGLAAGSPQALRVDSAQRSAAVILGILGGQTGPARDHALLNAAAALVVAGVAADLAAGVRSAAQAIDDGRARRKLDALVELSRSET